MQDTARRLVVARGEVLRAVEASFVWKGQSTRDRVRPDDEGRVRINAAGWHICDVWEVEVAHAGPARWRVAHKWRECVARGVGSGSG